MDIHKPKAAHSWREFLTEIGTIICGILIALGLEQAVEAVHRGQEVREAREALTAEIRGDAERLRLSVEEDECLQRQLDAYAAWARGGAKPPAFRAILPLLRTATWDTVKAGAVTHMPLKDRVEVAAFYDQLANAIKNRDKVSAGNEEVGRFDELAALDATERTALLKAVSLDRRAIHVAQGGAARLIAVADAISEPRSAVALPSVLRPGVDWACGRTSADPYAVDRR